MARHARPVWQQAYDAQMGLWRFLRSKQGDTYRALLYSEATNGMSETTQRMVVSIYREEENALLHGDPVFISRDMCDVIDAAKDSFQPERILPTDFLTMYGFAHFARPITILDRRDTPCAIHGFAWAPVYAFNAGIGKNVSAWINQLVADGKADEDELDRVNATIEVIESAEGYVLNRLRLEELDEEWVKENPGKYPPGEQHPMDALHEAGATEHGVALVLYGEGQRQADRWFADQQTPERRDRLAGILGTLPGTVPIHVTQWWFNHTFEGNELDETGLPSAAVHWWKLVQTTLRLMQQRVARVSDGRPDRASRREGMRLSLPHDRKVVVVQLRRESNGPHPDHEPGEAHYSHRFIVGGHWRNQWYPSEQMHRQIWISDYVKGPEDAPLRVRPRRVFQWTR